MTYRELLQALQMVSPEALDQTVTVYLEQEDEFLPIAGVELEISDGETDVLDPGHLYMIIE